MSIDLEGASAGTRMPLVTRRALAVGLQCLIGILAAAILAGCSVSPRMASVHANSAITGSGDLVTRELDARGFTGVEAGSAFKVDIFQSDSYLVSITADDNVVDRVQAEVTGNVLTLSLIPGGYHDATYSARIGLPDLRSLALSEATTATVAGFKSLESTDFYLDGASKLTGRLESGKVRLVSDGASVTMLGGKAGSLSIEASGASQANLGDWTAGSASAHLDGASKATLNVEGQLDADLRGASTLYYVGSPTLGTINSIEASSLRSR